MISGHKEDRMFFDMFTGLSENSGLSNPFRRVRVDNVSFFKKSKILEIKGTAPQVVPYTVVRDMEYRLKAQTGFDSVSIKLQCDEKLTLDEVMNLYNDQVLNSVNSKVALSRGILCDCTWVVRDNELEFELKHKGAGILRAQSCDMIIGEFLRETFGLDAKITFSNPDTSDESICEYSDYKEVVEDKATQVLAACEVKRPLNRQRADTGPVYENTKNQGKPRRRKTADKSAENDPAVIMGKRVTEPYMKMSEVTQESGRTTVCGEVSNVVFRDIRGGRYLCCFDISDNTSSLTAKFFIDAGDIDLRKEQIKEGLNFRVRGEAQYDRFSKELAIMATDITEYNKPCRMDEAEEKRVELHLHTQMSSMDAVTPAKLYVERAALWGHSAIAITDHGVVQAYPEAYDTAKKKGIKVIYGIECYLIDDGMQAVTLHGDINQDYALDDEFVVFDIETTGLSADYDKITEIGAIKVKNRKICGKFGTLVNPGVPIPENIVKLTGITDEMVKDAPDIEHALAVFLEFAENSPVVAHNASFDVGFISAGCRKIGRTFGNSVLDTLQLTRSLFPGIGKYKLNLVAKHLGIEMLNHHRAVDDAQTTAEILIKCFEVLHNRGIGTLKKIADSCTGSSEFIKTSPFHAILLAKNETGLKNLYKIVSESHLKHFYKKPRVPKSLLAKCREGLTVGSACEAGELFTAILEKKKEEDIQRIARYYDYLEIQPLSNNRFLEVAGKVTGDEELKDINRKIVALGEQLGIAVVATCDAHFRDPDDEIFRRILLAGQGYSDADRENPLYFRTTEEMLSEFAYLGVEKAFEVVVTNTQKIAGSITNMRPIPEGTYPPKIEGAEKEIEELTYKRARIVYGDTIPEIVRLRLEKELNSIIKNGFSVMYIIAQKLVSKSNEDGYIVGSRGSVGSSLVATMCAITEVNPLPPHYICGVCKYSEFFQNAEIGSGFDLPLKSCPKCNAQMKGEGHNIPFETFLGFDGEKAPDIDLNFSGEYQSRAHKYTEELFGKGNVYRAGTISSIAEKTAYGYVMKYLESRGKTATTAEVNRLAKGITGIKKTTGQHPGGIIIIPGDSDIHDFTPIQHPADDTGSDKTTTHFDFHSLHDTILKLDILGHDDPTMLKMLCDLTDIRIEDVPVNDPQVMQLFLSAGPLAIQDGKEDFTVGTIALPEFGTRFVRQMLQETKPSSFSDLLQISGLSHGTNVWVNNAQELVKKGICGISEVIGTRDNIMVYLTYKGLDPKMSFKIMESVRKGKGLTPEFEKAMIDQNIPDWYIDSCKKILYMFPKAHAAAYVMMALRIGWFKIYHPKAFYVAYFSIRADEFDSELVQKGRKQIKDNIMELEKLGNNCTQKEKNMLTILEVADEMYARGIGFLPVDLYHSDPVKFKITEDGIRPPLNSLQGLGTSAAANIAEARKLGNFLSIDELRLKAKLSKTVVDILRQSGCLNDLPDSSQMSLF